MKTGTPLSTRVKLGGRLVAVGAMLIAALGHMPLASAIDLCATTGAVSMPDGGSVPIWGYALGDCTGSPAPSLPGPQITVTEGDTVTVNLYNKLGVTTSLLFQGQNLIPDLTGVAPDGTESYTFTASKPGTYLYEAGLLAGAAYQAAMGLYGALIVQSATPGQAYASASTVFDTEAVLVLSEIDPALNNSAPPAGFDMRNYAPKYFLINGKAYPNTDEIPTAADDTVLLRYVNAGLLPYSMTILGLQQTQIAMDGSPFTHPRTLVAETIAPGQTADMLANIPADAANCTKYSLFDGNLMLHNNKTNNATGGFGGMLTFLTVPGPCPTGDTTGPLTSNVSLTSTSVTASVSDAGRGDSNVTAAEFFIDSAGANGGGTAMTGAFGAVTVNVSGTISPALSGNHTVYVHGQDAAGNWGPFASAVISNDTTGPTTSALALSPNPSNGTVNVALSATADDRASGGSNIAAGEYTIDGGAAQSMTVSPSGATVASLTATIPAATVGALTEGTHVVSVRSQDSLGNWGAFATIMLNVVAAGPTTSDVQAMPNPTNGKIGVNGNTAAVRLTAALTDAASNVAAAEGFIDTVGANGTGFPLIPSDGLFDSGTENAYVNIPLTTIVQLADGNHPLYVHGKNAAGNWGTTAFTTLVVDKTGPTITAASLSPSTIAYGTASVILTVTANDGTGTGVTGGQYWIDGTTTPPATPTAFNGTSATIDTSALAGGNHTLYVRVQDAAGNWSAVSSLALTVIQAVNDTLTITANNNASQTVNVAAPGLLTNDLPVGTPGRTAALVSAPVRTSGTGSGTLAVTCPPAAAAAVCANGSYRVTLSGVGPNGPARAASKRGTFQFTYTMTLNGVTTAPATVTITVN